MSPTSLMYMLPLSQLLYAYLQPGLGSYVTQLLLAALIASVVMFRYCWTTFNTAIKRLFDRRSKRDDSRGR